MRNAKSSAAAVASPEAVEIDDRLPTPLYHQIYLVLRSRIVEGEYPYNSVLPGEQELGRMFGVSRITIKRALSELAAEGFVSRHRGRGTVVRFRLPSPIVKASFDGLFENLRMMGLRTEVKLLEFTEIPAPQPIADALEIELNAPVQHALRLRSIEGEPFSYLVTHVPMDVGRNIAREDMTTTPLLTLLARACVVATSARQTISAATASPQISGALGLPVGAPVMKITRVVKDEAKKPVQHIVAYYRPDRFEYEMKLTRMGDDGEQAWEGGDR
ncbi:MAG: GntR family transcriptional regulator [Pseudomonadota bacterium]